MLHVGTQPGPPLMRHNKAEVTCCSFSLISRCSAEAAACLARSSAEAAVKRRLVSTIWARSSFTCGGRGQITRSVSGWRGKLREQWEGGGAAALVGGDSRSML